MGLRDSGRLLQHVVGDALVAGGEDVLQRRERRHEKGPSFQHLLDALLRYEDAVLDGIDAAANGVEDAFGSLGVARAGLVEAMPLGDAGGHLLGGVVGVFRVHARGHDAPRGHDLHEIGARVDLFADRAHDVVDTVGDAPETIAVAPRHADHAPGGADGRAVELPAVAGVPGGELEVVLTAAVTNRRDAAAQGALGIGEGAHRDRTGAHLLGRFAGVWLGVEAEVHVAVDEAREQGGVVQGHFFARVALERVQGGDSSDARVFYENAMLREGAADTIYD